MDGGYILPRVQNSHTSINSASIVDLENGQIKQVMQLPSDVVALMRKTFNTGKTKPYEFRMKQLKNLLRFLNDHEKGIATALYRDLRKPEHEAYTMEIDVVCKKIKHTMKNLKKWMKPEMPDRTVLHWFDKAYIWNDPYGVVLVMGAWNYPLLLTLSPVLGAIAAGNTVVIKPSDLSPHIADYMYTHIPQYLDRDCYTVFLGGVPETTELLKERFDYIFYTGSPQVGKIIHRAANQYLTPVTLELGGKSPTYLDSTADVEMATKRILWGKFSNCGQTCIAPDYLLCTPEVQEKFVHFAKKQLQEEFGNNIKLSKDFGRIVNERHFIRVANLLKNQKIAIGGNMDAEDLFIHPTILVDVRPEDDIMQEEIFGPVLPIINVADEREAVKFINEREKPLALYVFTSSSAVKKYFLDNTSSGGVCINDTLMHIVFEDIPFGGVGNSGMGRYHGKHSFDTFVHKKSVLQRNFWKPLEMAQALRYPPFHDKRTSLMRTAVSLANTKVTVIKYIPYLIMFGLGIGVTMTGYYIQKQMDDN